ncbi:MAG: hypothetical protein HY743_05050, partial [Deltaproteobacteria bacterium]|nr:hypothetical protein [Deltaproteobacteria bacterium]
AGADEFAGALLRKLGVMALVIAGFYKLEQAAVGAFKAGIQAADEYLLTTIGVAATLTDIAKEGVNSQMAYAQNIAYSKDMYNELELAAARHFASGKDMVQAWNILSQKGIVLRKEEIDDLGVIVDKIKLVTAGQVQSIQVAQELRAMLTGQARATDQLAMLLRDRYGSAWEEILKKHREAGDLLPWLAGEFKGLKYASEDIVGTLYAQKTTLETLLSQVGRTGLAGAYEDITGLLKQANEYLSDHKTEIQGGIYRGWIAVKDLVEGVHGFLSEIDKILTKLGGTTYLIKIAVGIEGAKWFSQHEMGQNIATGFGALGADYYDQLSERPVPPGAEGRFSRLSDIQKNMEMRRATTGSEKFFMLPNGDIVPMSVIEEAAPTRKMAGDTGGKGGGGGEGALNSMRSLMDRLNQDIARLSEGSLAAVDAWYDKTVNDINKLVAKGVEGNKALELAAEAAILKKEKIEQDFYSWAAKESGDHYTSIVADTNKWLLAVGQNAEMATKVMEIHYERTRKQRDKDTIEGLSLQKSQLDALAGALPYLDQQLAVKRRILPLEAEINRLTLEQKLRTLEIPDALKDELRGYAALTAEAKRFNLEMEKNKGLSGWAWSRAKEADQKNTIKDMMGGLESGFQNAFSSGLQGVLSQDKKSLQNIGKTMWQGFLGEIHKGGITRVFDSAAKMLAPSPKGGAGTDLTAAGQILNTAGLQLVTSAGGLLLSGIGIATNSQDLVIAGTVLQMAGLAIQVYQMLTATTEVSAAVALTGAAGALTAAAIALQMAAYVDAATFWHSGGVVAHAGWLVAHDGLNLDERRVIAQTGEGIIQRRTMEEYARQGITFDMLNSGRLPVVPAPVAVPMAREAGPSGGNANGGSVVNIGDVHLHIYESEMTAQKADLLVRRHVMPALSRELGRYGVKLGR